MGNLQNPDITVVITSYNNSKFVCETVESVLSQVGVNFEVIVVDDCSSDNSVELLTQFENDPRFSLRVNPNNLGAISNYNYCVGLGVGKYVCVISSDDVLYSGHLSSLFSALERHPECCLAYTQCDWIDSDSNFIKRAVHPGHLDHSYNGGRNELACLLAYDNYITPSAVMLRRDVLKKIRLPDGNIHLPDMLAGDWELWTRIARFSPNFAFVCKATVGYRIHENQISSVFYGSERPLSEHLRILEFNLQDELSLPKIQELSDQIWRLYEFRLNAYGENIRRKYASRSEDVKNKLFSINYTDNFPFFSVILTTFNRRNLLQDALLSLERQEFNNFEVILINDFGEPVEDLLQNFDLTIFLVRQGRNLGLSAARNVGLKIARGRYVVYLDDDDIYLPDHLKCLAAVFKSYPDSLVYTDVVYVQEMLENGERVEVGRSFPTAHEAFDRDKLFIQNYIPVNTWAHPRAAIAEIGNFDTSLTALEDWDMLLRLVQHYPVHRVEKVTAEVHQRVSGGDDHMLARERDKLLPLYRKLYERYPETGNERVRTGRRAVLTGQALQETPWGVLDWMADRAPSAARILAIQTMLGSNSDVGTLGVAVIVPDDAGPQAVADTLASLTAQHRPIDGIWLIGSGGGAVTAKKGVEYICGQEPWPQLLSQRVAQGGIPDFLWILYAGDQLLPHATLTIGEYRLRQPDPLIWYADEAIVVGGVAAKPMLKPDFNIDLLRSYPYVGRNLVFSTAVVHAVGGLDGRVADLAPIDLIWRLVEQVGPGAVGHVPDVLSFSKVGLMDWICTAETMVWFPAVTQSHLVRIGSDARVVAGAALGINRIDYSIGNHPLVSIIVPTRDQLPVLQACIESLMENTDYSHYELLVIDNGSISTDAVQFLSRLETMRLENVRVLHWPAPFSFSAIGNFAAGQARGEVLLFLDNDIEVTEPGWLSLMLGHALRPEVGVVGARLDYPDGRVQHAGLVLGLDNSVGFGFRGVSGDGLGYMNRLCATQNVGAVSGSCLMVRRDVFNELGGFDEKGFPGYYSDADLCLRATKAGYLVTLAAEAKLQHMGGATRLMTEKFGQAAVPDVEQEDHLYAKWLPKLARDPAYHPGFGRFSPGFDLSPDASRIHDPLPGRPLPVVLASHVDWHGCGHYRILYPYQAMESELRLEGGVKLGNFHFADVARIEPDTIVLQGSWANPGILDQIKRFRETTGAKVVLEFDDYLPNIPVRSAYRRSVPQSLIKKMRRAIERVDWLVVSTPALAHEYSDYHPDIRVALNGLPRSVWGALAGQRWVGRKPRVGWAGGSSHTGDLAEIRALVKDLEDDVDWVFMGMKPEGVRCEFHPGVPIGQYPAQLAALNLDLAVVPLEQNQFNRCKSNLRLLELGACGIPVICTDIEPYQCGLPVTLVRNRHRDWIAAIREHLADPDALARQGDSLREAVMDKWMLEGVFLEHWAQAWLSQ